MTVKRGAPPEEIAAVIADVLEEDEGWIAKRSSRGWETLALEVFVPYGEIVEDTYVATIFVEPDRIIISGNRKFEKDIKAVLMKRGFKGVRRVIE